MKNIDEQREPEEMDEQPEERQRDTRSFVERMDQTNVGFIVSLSPEKLKPFAAAVDKAIVEAGGTLRYTLDSSKRLSLREFRPFRGRDDRRDRRDDRPRRFDYGGSR